MALPNEEQDERGPGRRRKRLEDVPLSPAMRDWVTYARKAVDGTWRRRRDAELATGTEHARLSRLLSGEGVPPKEWLEALHEAREAAGHPVPQEERDDAYELYIAALKETEDAEERGDRDRARAIGWRPKRASIQYELERELQHARDLGRQATRQLQQAEQELAAHDAEVEEILDRIAVAFTTHDPPHPAPAPELLPAATTAELRLLHTQLADRRRRRSKTAARLRELEHQVQELHRQAQRLQTRRQRILDAARLIRLGLQPRDLLIGLIPTGAGLWLATRIVPTFTLHGPALDRLLALISCTLAFAILNSTATVLFNLAYHLLYQQADRDTDRDDSPWRDAALQLVGLLLRLLELASYSAALRLAVGFCDTVHLEIQLTGGWWPALLSALICMAVMAALAFVVNLLTIRARTA